MKVFNHIGMALCLLVGLASCEMREEILGKKDSQESGLLRLSVEAIAPKVQTKAAVATDDFAVSIVGVSEEVKGDTKNYDRVSDLPASIELSVGTYNVVSHTPGELEKQMDYPYYMGNKDLLIENGKDTQANVQCKMRNSRIQLTYTPEFLAAFESWTITLDDGSDIAYSISHDNRVGTSPKAGYYAFEENGAEFVTLNIRATTVTGNAVTFSQPYYKKDAESGYDENDGANFMGGDALLITLKPKAPDAPTSGTIGIDVTVNVLFANSDTEVKIEVNDKNQTPDPKPDPDPTPGGDGDLVLNLPEDITYSIKDAEFPKAVAKVLAPSKIKSMTVKIVAGNELLPEALELANSIGLDFLTGVDLVSQGKTVEALFTSLNYPEVKAPKSTDTLYEFPIDTFFSLLNTSGVTDMGKGHEFHITVVDGNNESKSNGFKVFITE